MVFDGGLILLNGGDGIDIIGKNIVFMNLKIIGNIGMGYCE